MKAPLFLKLEYVILNSNWTQEIMAGQKKKLRHLEETSWFPKYYIGWIGIRKCDQKTSTMGPIVCAFVITRNCPIKPTLTDPITKMDVADTVGYFYLHNIFGPDRAVISKNWMFIKGNYNNTLQHNFCFWFFQFKCV